ncbi:hypothetical protein BH11BAC4_BH11BAC4_23570 [soil metagenome]
MLFSLTALFFTACNSHADDKKTADLYEKGKAAVEQAEKKNPERFLAVSGNNKKNILGQTVIKGAIFNKGKIVSFKDVDIKLSFYSKTGALLEEDHEVIYETVEPGASKSFKTKYFAARGTDSVAMKVISAKY